MITCKLSGRTGNHLFQIAATYAHSLKMKTDFCIPIQYKWHARKEFNCPFNLPIKDIDLPIYKEPNFYHNHIPKVDNICLDGYFQSEKYWIEYIDDVKELFSLGSENISYHKAVCISVRLGDYVNNPNYAQIDKEYYISAYRKYFNGHPIMMFSDDIELCKIIFHDFDDGNILYVQETNPYEQLRMASWCNDFIISNSTFSWWMAYLGENIKSTVIRPTKHFAGDLLKLDIKDYYPNHWIPYDKC
jgi:hypothetical protein